MSAGNSWEIFSWSIQWEHLRRVLNGEKAFEGKVPWKSLLAGKCFSNKQDEWENNKKVGSVTNLSHCYWNGRKIFHWSWKKNRLWLSSILSYRDDETPKVFAFDSILQCFVFGLKRFGTVARGSHLPKDILCNLVFSIDAAEKLSFPTQIPRQAQHQRYCAEFTLNGGKKRIKNLCKPGAYFFLLRSQQNRFFPSQQQHRKAFFFTKANCREKRKLKMELAKGNWKNV